MSKKHYAKVFKFLYISICGRVLNGPILIDNVDSVEHHASTVNNKGVII
jgi:hypothetical protein